MSTRFVLAVGTTRTATIDGISAAGADADAMVHTPAADAEVVTYGRPVWAPETPVSPTGCPTPAVVTRAVREHLGLDCTVVDAGLAVPTAAPTVGVGGRPGADVREADPVPTAPGAFETARELGRAFPDDHLVLGESIPGGTTTALGVLAALGEVDPGAGPDPGGLGVSSSLPENPVPLKREVVAAALTASEAAPGDFAGDPTGAVRHCGDPVLAVLSGLVVGAVDAGTPVTLAGGTQQLAVAALVRHAGCEAPLALATTSYVADDPAVDVEAAAARFDCDCTVTDPGFDDSDGGLARYAAGEGKEGVGMGGALALADDAGLPMAAVRDRAAELVDRLVDASDPVAEDER